MEYLIIHTVQCTRKDCSPIQNLFGSSHQPERKRKGVGQTETEREVGGKKRLVGGGGGEGERGSLGVQLINTNKTILLAKEEWQAVA